MFYAKLSVCFVALCVLVGSSFAAPDPTLSRRASTGGPFPTDFEESVKQLTTTVDKSFKGFVENTEWMFHTLNKIFRTTGQKGFAHVATWAADILTRSELFMIADGSHFIFPVSGNAELEQEYKTVAIAVSKMYRNLKTMERADKAITNATKTVIVGDPEPHVQEMKPEKMFRTLLHMYIEALDHQFAADEELSQEYRKEKNNAKEFVKRDPKMRAPLLKITDEKAPVMVGSEELQTFLRDKKVFREAVLNKQFLKQAMKHFWMIFSPTHYEHFLLARALIEKAKSADQESKVHELYRRALTRAAEQYEVVKYAEGGKSAEDLLFESIEKALEREPSLHAEIETIEKQIEDSDIYDTDVLHVDFSFL